MICNKICLSSCIEFDCRDDCCRFGVDIPVEEYTDLISNNLATSNEFTGPGIDENCAVYYRTRVGQRGCVFLLPQRGCRLHGTGHKPCICQSFPRTFEEAETAYQEGYLPCFNQINEKGVV